MKNEMMCYYRKFHLPSKKPEYMPYMDVNWKEFVTEKKICCAELFLWVDKALASEKGKMRFEGHMRNFNKTHNPNDCL